MSNSALQTGSLVVDIGNTQSVFGIFDGDSVSHVRRVASHERSRSRVRDELKELSLLSGFTNAIIGSVVPSLNTTWQELLQEHYAITPLLVSPELELGISIDYPNPENIGADRLANACAACKRFGSPVVVADFGTALTFDLIGERNVYLGGVIAPGLPMMTDYLADKTALLPRIDLYDTASSIGKSTEDAMCIGANIGYRGIARELLGEIESELNAAPLTVVATGGYSEQVLRGLDLNIQYWPDLTLCGLGYILSANPA